MTRRTPSPSRCAALLALGEKSVKVFAFVKDFKHGRLASHFGPSASPRDFAGQASWLPAQTRLKLDGIMAGLWRARLNHAKRMNAVWRVWAGSITLITKNIFMWYTYVLYSKKLNNFYTGCTHDLKQRIKDHVRGKVQTTKKFDELDLVYYEACYSKKDAQAREKQLKIGFGRGYLKRRLENYFMGV